MTVKDDSSFLGVSTSRICVYVERKQITLIVVQELQKELQTSEAEHDAGSAIVGRSVARRMRCGFLDGAGRLGPVFWRLLYDAALRTERQSTDSENKQARCWTHSVLKWGTSCL